MWDARSSHDNVNGTNDVSTITADGLGTITFADDSSSGLGLGGTLGDVTYTIAPNGRGTGSDSDSGHATIFYMISPGKFVALRTNAEARVDVFEH